VAPVAPDDVDRVLARLDAAARAVGGTEHPDAPISVELVVHTADGDRSWFVELDQAGGRAALGPAPEATVIVRIHEDTYDALRSGALDVQRAIDGGRLTVRGDLGALARSRGVLRALGAALTD
jgi:hypothetical protein